MLSYMAWNECVEYRMPEFIRAEADVRAKLTSVKHVVNFKVSSQNTSKMVLDRPGVEHPLERGYLAPKLNGKYGSHHAQALFLSDEIAAAVTAVSHNN